MRATVRRLLETGLGVPGRALLAWRTRSKAERLLDRRGVREVAAAVATSVGGVVAAGPFAGMRYPRRFGDIVHAAKLLGTYEREVHTAIGSLVDRAPAVVVNIGSGDGYYAVGLARLLPRATVYAVDPDPLAQRACHSTATLNAVDARIRPVVRVDADALARLLAVPGDDPALLVVDCEGVEDELLDLALAPGLSGADLLVETHDFARDGVTTRLLQRFEATHRIGRIEVETRDASPDAYPSLRELAPALRTALLDEYRHMPQSWLVMFSRSRP